jgi:hypothetical protein
VLLHQNTQLLFPSQDAAADVPQDNTPMIAFELLPTSSVKGQRQGMMQPTNIRLYFLYPVEHEMMPPPCGTSQFWDVAHCCNCNNLMIDTVLVFSDEHAINKKIDFIAAINVIVHYVVQ